MKGFSMHRMSFCFKYKIVSFKHDKHYYNIQKYLVLILYIFKAYHKLKKVKFPSKNNLFYLTYKEYFPEYVVKKLKIVLHNYLL